MGQSLKSSKSKNTPRKNSYHNGLAQVQNHRHKIFLRRLLHGTAEWNENKSKNAEMVSGMEMESMSNIELIRELNLIRKGLSMIARDAILNDGFSDDRPCELEILGERLKDLADDIKYYNAKTKSASEYGLTLEDLYE